MRRVVLFGSVLILSAVAPAYAQTSTATGPFSGSISGSAPSAAPVQLTLADALDRALRFNLGMVTAEQQIESARGARLRSLRDLLPRIDTRAGETRQTTNLAAFGFDPSLFPGVPAVVGPFDVFDARVAASQPVFDLGALNDVRSKTSALNAARFDAQNARDVVTLVVTNLYLQAVAGQSRIQTARDQVATAEALLTLATNLRNAGAAPGIDVVRAQVQLQTERQRLIAAENDSAKQVIQLARAIGIPTAQPIELTDRTMPDTAVVPPLDEALRQAAAARPDYKASLERVHAAESALRSARADGWPSVQVSGDYGAIGSTVSDARRTYSMSANVRLPLFDNDRRGRVVEETAALREREAAAADLAQRIEAEVRSALLDVQAAQQQVAVARDRVTLANQELSLAQTRFSVGVTSNLEVIQAQNEVSAATENQVNAVYAFNVANAALRRAIGAQTSATVSPVPGH
jgi:outer membrane protein TolC